MLKKPTLNAFAALPWADRTKIRDHIQNILSRENVTEGAYNYQEVQMHLPMKIGKVFIS